MTHTSLVMVLLCVILTAISIISTTRSADSGVESSNFVCPVVEVMPSPGGLLIEACRTIHDFFIIEYIISNLLASGRANQRYSIYFQGRNIFVILVYKTLQRRVSIKTETPEALATKMNENIQYNSYWFLIL